MAPNIFSTNMKQVSHIYPTRHSNLNFEQPMMKSSQNFLFQAEDLTSYLSKETKTLTSLSSFKTSIKKQLLNQENELQYF